MVGFRNHALNRSAFSLGQLVGIGCLDKAIVESRLVAVALSIGLAEREARRTVASGLTAGIANPRSR